ncbi:hypothetical protein QN277_005637 [Acacia crassicarpa]|uniref:Uncharacterized protein n=1 Tax=Acacia crassicarpa TaxID=499986 RepID=A0AAE1IWT3_9FABA|nr:hypothetical protein QN277_005637 [Acacia crassicarpa]
MAENLSSSFKDLFLAKASKSSTKIGILDIKVVSNTTCPEPIIEPWEMPHVHYPKLQKLTAGLNVLVIL